MNTHVSTRMTRRWKTLCAATVAVATASRLPAVQKAGIYLSTCKQFPPRQRPAGFSIDQLLEKLIADTKSP